MQPLRHILLPTLWTMALFISACSVNLTRGTTPSAPKGATEATALFKSIPLILGSDTLWLEQDLLAAYNHAVPNEIFPQRHCRGTAKIWAQVNQNTAPPVWSLPLAIIPFWPIMPVDETWTYNLEARIYCDEVLVKHVNFTEEETVQAYFYGKMRSDLLNDASENMHRKLVQRFAFELNYGFSADLGSRSDY